MRVFSVGPDRQVHEIRTGAVRGRSRGDHPERGFSKTARVLIIGYQVSAGLGAPMSYVAVVELKRDRMPREVVEEIRRLHELWPELAL